MMIQQIVPGVNVASEITPGYLRMHLEVLYQSCSNYVPGVKIDPAPGVTILHWFI